MTSFEVDTSPRSAPLALVYVGGEGGVDVELLGLTSSWFVEKPGVPSDPLEAAFRSPAIADIDRDPASPIAPTNLKSECVDEVMTVWEPKALEPITETRTNGRLKRAVAKLAVFGMVASGATALIDAKSASADPGPVKCESQVLSVSTGNNVKCVKFAQTELGFTGASVDGVFGTKTSKAVEAARKDRDCHLKTTGKNKGTLQGNDWDCLRDIASRRADGVPTYPTQPTAPSTVPAESGGNADTGKASDFDSNPAVILGIHADVTADADGTTNNTFETGKLPKGYNQFAPIVAADGLRVTGVNKVAPSGCHIDPVKAGGKIVGMRITRPAENSNDCAGDIKTTGAGSLFVNGAQVIIREPGKGGSANQNPRSNGNGKQDMSVAAIAGRATGTVVGQGLEWGGEAVVLTAEALAGIVDGIASILGK